MFPLGALRPDGRVDLCKQGLGAPGVARLLPVATASPHAVHLLLGTNAIGDEGRAPSRAPSKTGTACAPSTSAATASAPTARRRWPTG